MRRRVALAFALVAGCALARVGTAWARMPYSDSELRAVETDDEAKITDLRADEIRQLRITLGRRQPRDRRADLYYRLAELYLEGYHQEYILEGRVHDKRLDGGRADPTIDHSHSRPYLTGGITACREILSLGISYPRMDQIYYFLAFNHTELGDRREGLRYYAELARRYPDSPFVSEAYRELGDDAYDNDHFFKAIGYYQQAIRKAGADDAPRVYQKLAWSYYRTKQFELAIDTMKSAISLAEKDKEKFLSLREEALRDMAIFMTETGRVDDAIAYFRDTVGDQTFYPKVLEKLGKQYERNVEPAKATRVYESLLRTSPGSEEAFRVLVKLVDLDLRRQRFREALDRLKDLQEPSGGEDDTRVAAQNLRAMIRRTATEHHEVYRKKGDRSALLIADAYYTAYLDLFLAKSDPRGETQEIKMYLAEVKRDLGDSRDASRLYREVVESRDPRYAKEAGALWTASLSDAIKKAPATGKTSEPSALETEYVKAADKLQDALGDTAEGREAALRAAQVLAGYPDTRSEAIHRIRKIIDSSPRSAQALTGARLLVQLQAQNPKSDDGDMKDLIKDLRSNEELMAADRGIGKGKLRAAMADQETRLKVSAISRDERDEDFSDAAKGYEAFAQGSAQRDVAEKAYQSAVAAYLKGGDDESAQHALGEWLARYPASRKAVESLQEMATRFLIQGKFEPAADLFERAGSASGDATAFETAGRILEGIGNVQRSLVDRARYARDARDPASRAQALISLARLYESARMDREATQAYRDCMAFPSFHAECGSKLADLDLKLKNRDDAFALYREVAAEGPRSPSPAPRPRRGRRRRRVAESAGDTGPLSPYVGYARFKLADAQEQGQSLPVLAFPESTLKSSLAQRMAFLESISRAYTSVADAGGPWAVAALDRLGKIAYDFADAIDAIAPRRSMDAQGVKALRKSLAAISSPLRRKAIETWRDAYRKAVEAGALSPVLPELADRLADAGSPPPARAQGFRGKLVLAGIPSDGGDDGQDKAFEKTRARLLRNPREFGAWVDYGNLLWGTGKPVLARLAYDRALELDPKYGQAQNNRAVVLLSDAGEEDWKSAAQAQALFQDALKRDSFFVPAKSNLALLFDYYRLFERARPLWEQILVRNDGAVAEDGLAVALQGLGDPAGAEAAFSKAHDLGADSSRFAAVYHRAARALDKGAAGDCLDALSDLSSDRIGGFETSAADRLKRACTARKGGS